MDWINVSLFLYNKTCTNIYDEEKCDCWRKESCIKILTSWKLTRIILKNMYEIEKRLFSICYK